MTANSPSDQELLEVHRRMVLTRCLEERLGEVGVYTDVDRGQFLDLQQFEHLARILDDAFLFPSAFRRHVGVCLG